LFESLQTLPADAILGVLAEYRQDNRAHKIDLGVGVYRDENGDTPVLGTVKKAERHWLEYQISKAYLGSRGDPDFNAAMQALLFGAEQGNNSRIYTLQTPGGCGSLRVGAELILRGRAGACIWVSDPTWANHVPLLSGAGLQLKTYPYYDAANPGIRFAEMLEGLSQIPVNDIILLHACCHNPSGMDLSREQWQAVSEIIVERNLLPFVDIAYQGFAEGLDEDAYPIRLLADLVPEMIVSASCSKNFGLYRDRVGSLSVVVENPASVAKVDSQLVNIVRGMYSMPPAHGGSIVTHILSDQGLRAEWDDELTAMRERLKSMRGLIATELAQRTSARDFSFIERAQGMFSFLGLTPQQVQRLKSEYGVYMVDSSRINVAGINHGNVAHLADAIVAVL
jgi:aspartate/tyrosine/aromatic aminotransferase